MTAPICVKCRIVMRCAKTGVDVELMAGHEGYQIWNADCFVCPECNVSVISGFGKAPLAEHFQPEYAKFAEQLDFQFWATLKEKQDAPTRAVRRRADEC